MIPLSVCAVMLAACLGVASGYGIGAPAQACDQLKPIGHWKVPGGPIVNELADEKGLWTIASACYVIHPNEQMKMRVQDIGGGKFRGLILQVRDSSNKPSGTWQYNQNDGAFKTMQCNSARDTITHQVPALKVDKDHVFIWKSPANCKDEEEFMIRATVARERYEFEENIAVRLLCNPDYSNEEALLQVRPPSPLLYCAQGAWAIIPKGIATSFEDGTFGTWKPLYPTNKYKWHLVTNNGSTPSPRTGPDFAQHGKAYAYFEASTKPSYGTASLYSIYGLQGCICFSFWCHMNTDGEASFSLVAMGGGKGATTLINTAAVNLKWTQMRVSFTSKGPITLIFHAYKGTGFRGDIGIDNIQVTAGKCTNPFPKKQFILY